MANIVVFDTETTSVGEKPFLYDIGYVIIDPNTQERLAERSFVCEQTWHNNPLFATAYYADKRPKYVDKMRKHLTIMDKYGYIMRQMIKDFKVFDVVAAYAYNSPFDDKVITFNCDWYHCRNPFDNVPIFDIRGLANSVITDTEPYKVFCEEHERFTDSGNYSATAETVYQFITNDPDFVEEHMGYEDSTIEAEILCFCLNAGCELMKDYPVKKILPRQIAKPLTIKVDKKVIFNGTYVRKTVRNDVINITTEG